MTVYLGLLKGLFVFCLQAIQLILYKVRDFFFGGISRLYWDVQKLDCEINVARIFLEIPFAFVLEKGKDRAPNYGFDMVGEMNAFLKGFLNPTVGIVAVRDRDGLKALTCDTFPDK